MANEDKKILTLCCMTIRICQNFRQLRTKRVLKSMVEAECILLRQSIMIR